MLDFEISKSQRKVLRKFNNFLLKGKGGDQEEEVKDSEMKKEEEVADPRLGVMAELIKHLEKLLNQDLEFLVNG